MMMMMMMMMFNIAEATNFTTEKWIPYGLEAKVRQLTA
jgi:hypothetical protein